MSVLFAGMGGLSAAWWPSPIAVIVGVIQKVLSWTWGSGLDSSSTSPTNVCNDLVRIITVVPRVLH